MLGLRETGEAAGRVGWQPASDAGTWVRVDEEVSWSSWSDSLSDSLEAEAGSSKKLRVLFSGEASRSSPTGLENRQEGDEHSRLRVSRVV